VKRVLEKKPHQIETDWEEGRNQKRTLGEKGPLGQKKEFGGPWEFLWGKKRVKEK